MALTSKQVENALPRESVLVNKTRTDLRKNAWADVLL
jgi:hypothetical protein